MSVNFQSATQFKYYSLTFFGRSKVLADPWFLCVINELAGTFLSLALIPNNFRLETQHFDPFGAQKLEAFRSSATGASTLAQSFTKVLAEADHDGATNHHATFLELVQAALWGNATDLSLLTNLSHADIQALQTGGSADLVLQNHAEAAWKHLSSLKSARIDIILDNSGFELFTVRSGVVSRKFSILMVHNLGHGIG